MFVLPWYVARLSRILVLFTSVLQELPAVPDGGNINTADPDFRGNLPAQLDPTAPHPDGSRVLYGEHREGGVDVWAELVDGRISRVIPMSTICVADGTTHLPPLEGGIELVKPAPYVPRRPGWYYWAILQGSHTGIFYGTV